MSTDTSAFSAARLTVVTDDRVRSVQESARVSGYAAGFAAGSRAAAESTRLVQERLRDEVAASEAARDAEHRAAVLTLERAARAAQERLLPVLDDARDLLHTLAFDLARSVVGHDLADSQASAQGALHRALAVPHDVRIQTVRLHPSDLAILRASGTDAVDGIELVADPSLSPGDAVSTFEGGYFDARIRSSFDRALRALEESAAASAEAQAPVQGARAGAIS
ncbi:FliH/SctL family protein [Sanguibacter antarcticus]|uniref:Flagellar assembly protein FliH/type III secretion protein L n=1 Tax=Sanguibacter antarcticus TaxID=372484 RepID=A0A2A9E059_9MICO|nr:FliH/SctL family protein [Sanguibacter antarcticus]PFG32233.1 flagellar assembly protein FliH/type III secretion protein L [Sanguibacter antarcticus]